MSVRRLAPLMAVLAIAVSLLVSIPSEIPGAIQTCVGVPAILVAPGYAFTHLLWPNRRLTGAVRLVFVLAASLSLLVLAGLLTAALPFGMSALSVSTTLLIVTTGLVGIGFVVRRQPATEESVGESSRQWRRRDIAGLALALVIAVSAIAIARTAAIRTAQQSTFTQLYFVPSRAGQGVTIGVRSFETGRTEFRLVLRTVRGHSFTQTIAPIRLAQGETFTRTVTLPTGIARGDLRIMLYRAGDIRAYRTIG